MTTRRSAEKPEEQTDLNPIEEIAPQSNSAPVYPPRPGACKKCGEKRRSDGCGGLICPVDDENCPVLANS